MARLLGIAALSLLGLLVLPIAATAQQPTVLYVNRSDPICGGQSPCYSTIQSAINAAQAGNIIRIQAGSYAEQLALTGKNYFQGATEVDRIVIEADPATQPGDVILTGAPGACTGNHAIRLQQSRFITIRGLTITGTGGQAISLLGGNNQNQDIHIELNRIFANGSGSCNGGITVARGNPGTLIVNNLIYANGRNGVTFIDADGGPHYIINNTIYGNQWNGVDVARNHTVTLANNIINNNGTATGTTGGRFGVKRESSTSPQPAGIKLLNNLVCGNTQGQITAEVLDATDSSNYTPVGNEGPGVGALPGCELPANLFTDVDGADNVANTADDDFSLKSNSLAIDVGMDPRTLGFNPSYNPIFEADFVIEGIRPADGNADRTPAFDAGAFEFPNSPPIANAGANQPVSTNQFVTLNGTQSSDPEGAPLTFQWTIVSEPAGSSISLSGATSATPSFTPLIAGQYIIQLVVSDGQFNSAPSTVIVTAVVANQAPTANNATATTDEDAPVVVTLTGSDPDSSSLTFTIVSEPTNGVLGTLSSSNCVPSGAGSNCTVTVTHTPNGNFSGSDSFTFKVSDGGLDSNIATVSITVAPVNDPPVANNTSVSANEDTSVEITLSASDVDSASLAFAVVNGPTNGTLSAISSPTCVAAGAGSNCTVTVTYAPAANFNGSDSFTFKANDGMADSNTATVSIAVNAVNDAPVANGQTVLTAEDAPVVITLSAGDVDSSSVSFSVVANPASGTLGAISVPNCVANGAGTDCTATATYSPAGNFNGSDNFTFKVNDGSLDSNIATVNITIDALNDNAVAANDFYSTAQDRVLTVGAPGVLSNDNDPDSQGNSLSAVLVSGPSNAAAFALNAEGSFNYTPNVNFTGTDTFTYKANDGASDSNEATVTIAVVQTNNAPVATNDFYNIEREVALSVPVPGVLANDNDLDTPPAGRTAILIDGPARAASFTLNPDGSFDYTPNVNFTGTDSFTYKVNDGTADSNVAMVTIAVIQPNTFPVARNDAEAVNEDSALSIAAPGVLANDSTSPLTTSTAILVSGPERALSFALNADGSFNYTPQADFYGADSFAYRIFDGANYSNVAMMNIEVAPVNDPPAAQSQSVSTNENTPVVVTLSASDIDSTSLSFSIATPPSHGSLGNIGAPNCTVQGQGADCTATVTYIPAANYFGPDSFSFTAGDGSATSAAATVSITVIQVNHPPTANAGGPYTGFVGVPLQFNGSGNDPDGNSITFSWDFGDGGVGSGPSPTHTYTAQGTYTVTLTVTDSFGASAVSQTTATISPALDLNPIGNKTVNLGETLTFTVTATSGTGSPVSLYVAPLPLMTNASFNAGTGVFTFRPSTLQVGSYQLNFSARDGVNSASETITITVPNPPPGGTTSVRGKVVNLAQTPLANVSVTLKSSGHTALTGADGFFTLTGVPSGTQQLMVNGRNSNLGVYAILAVAVELIDGVLNDLSGVISLPDVDVETEVQVSSTFNTVVTSPNLPGVELEIVGGSATNPDGTPFTGKLSINPVPDYGRPESRPEELRPGMAVTIQPAGIRFNPPARITFPNADGMAPGNQLNLWSLSPDTGKFNMVGTMAVSSDGQSFITVSGGVTASAWHFPLASSPTPVGDQGNNFCGSCRTQVGSEANLEEGSLYQTHSLPSYRALGQSRSVSLTYSSVTADPKPIISADTTLAFRAAVPATFSSRLKIGGVQQGGELFTNTGTLPEDADSTSRLAHQFDAANLATGRYSYEFTVFSNYLNSSIGGIANGNTIVVNGKDSPFGSGWAITDLQQLHPQSGGGVLLTSGDGTALFFSGGPVSFVSPARDFSTLARNPDSSFIRMFKDGTKLHFNAQGYQTSVVDRNGNTTNFTYDENNRLTTVTDAVGLLTTLTYGASGKLSTISDPAGRQTQFQHDGKGSLVRITNPDGTFVRYNYDSAGRMIETIDERGNSTTYTHDFAGRFAQSTRPGGETRSLVSSKFQGLPNGSMGFGTPTNPAPIVRTENSTASLTDGRGTTTYFTLNSLGQIISQRDPLGQTTTTVRDSNGLPTRITGPNGAVTTMTYDAKGNVLTSTDPFGATTTFTYEPTFNQVKTIRDPKGNLTTINYDLKGNPVEIIDALNIRAQMTYDSRGLLTSVTSAVGTPVQTITSFTYDVRGNLLTTTNPKGDVTTVAYDSTGNVSTSTDAENRVTQFTYDARNRLITVLDADLKTTQYGYDPKGNLTQVQDAKNQVTTFTHDGLDRLVSATNPLGLTETFAYDGNSNLTSTTNRNGQTITFNYDSLNRLTSKTRPPTSAETGNQATTYSYDAVGNLLSVINPTIGVFNQYDAANRLVSSLSTTETVLLNTVTPINVDTTISANNLQFEGKTLQVNGRTLTVNGSHTFANLFLVNGGVLTHSPTTGTTTGKLDITVTGTLQIDSTSRIDVSGRGFLGHRQPGNNFNEQGMTLGFQAGSLCATGGGYGGLGGASGCSAAVSNPAYGDFRNPNEVGSGGGGVLNGLAGNGGGLIRIVAQNIQISGSIVANGQIGAGDRGAGGSGGAIRIDVGTLQGTGTMSARGGNGGPTGSSPAVGTGGGGGGRIAIYYQNASGFDFANALAQGGNGNSAPNGGAGTVYLQGAGRENGELVIDNNNVAVAPLSTPIPQISGTIALTHFRVKRQAKARVENGLTLTGTLELNNGAEYITGAQITANTINILSSSVLTHFGATTSTFGRLFVNATSFNIDTTSRVDASARGFLGHRQANNPFNEQGMTLGFQAGSLCATGGGYGGLGGTSGCSAAVSNPAYGDFRNPNEPGSGGGGVLNGLAGNGGGLVRIVAQTMHLDGAIIADGQTAPGERAGGGSGGGLRLDVGTLQGTGSIFARGGNGGPTGVSPSTATGGGGGGRIAIYYEDITGFNLANAQAHGGLGTGGPNGGAGTVYLQGPAREAGELIIDNNSRGVASLTSPIPNPANGTIALTHLRIKRAARAKLDSILNISQTFELSSGSEVVVSARIIAGTTTLTGASVLTHSPTTASAVFKVDLSTTSLTIDAASRIDANSRGFLGSNQPSNPLGERGMTIGFAAGTSGSAGGSYGGLGGVSGNSFTNPLYGTATNPNEVGSGGGNVLNSGSGGNGGGLIRIVAQTLQFDGTILANGQNGLGTRTSGGSGGGIRIDVGTLQGTGSITARGGNGAPTDSFPSVATSGGGGGRVAIYYQNGTGFNFINVTAPGGTGVSGPNGQNGTVRIQQQIAMRSPSEEAPVMKAQAVSSPSEPNRLAYTEVPQHRVLDPTVLIRQTLDARPQTPERNRYAAMVAEGKLKPFATTAMLSKGTGVSPESADSVVLTRDGILETRNSSEACCLLPGSPLTPADLDPIYTYDLNGNRTSMIDPTGLTTYVYDSLNRLVSLTNNKGQVTSFTYDALGRRTSLTHANGVVTSYTYDAASQLLTLGHQFGATTINLFSYTYDKVGNRKTKTTRDGLHDYTYDVLNRLAQASNPLPTNPLETFSYDPVGNRTNSNQNGASTFNQTNQLLEDVNFTYQYDNNGNTTRKTAKVGGAVTTYEYDAENKLVRVVSPTNTASYRYDGVGRRVEKEVIAGTTTVTKYVYENEDILLEVNGSNTIVARYTHGPGIDEPLIMEKNSQSFYYHADGLSSITELTNQSGAVVQKYAYSSFGKIESQLDPNFVQPYAYTSREFDQENSLIFYRTRNYDASVGRFVQPDPIGFVGGPNFYVYTGNNPVYFVDPFGLDAVDVAANVAAGLGDVISLGLTHHVRDTLKINHVVDQCSTAYSVGWWAGMFHQLAFSGVGAFNGGARSVFYGGKGALEAARTGKGVGILLEDTLGGKLLNLIDKNFPLPDAVWKPVSAIFSMNAKGDAQVFLRNPEAGRIWNTIERPILEYVNKIHAAITGGPAMKIIPR